MAFRIDTETTIDKQLRQDMFRLRKQVFCDMLDWDIPHCNGQEADIFDFNTCFYLNYLDVATGALLGCVRLIPLMRDNLMTTVFKRSLNEASGAELRRSAHVWEGTRLCLNESLFAPKDRSAALVKLLFGLFMACDAMGIKKLLCNCDGLMHRRYRALGLLLEHLGATEEFRHGAVHTLGFDISLANYKVLNALAQKVGFETPLVEGEGVRAARVLMKASLSELPAQTGFSMPTALLARTNETPVWYA